MRSGARSQRKLARVSVKGYDMGHLIAKKAPDVVIFEKGIPWDIQKCLMFRQWWVWMILTPFHHFVLRHFCKIMG